MKTLEMNATVLNEQELLAIDGGTNWLGIIGGTLSAGAGIIGVATGVGALTGGLAIFSGVSEIADSIK